MYCVCSVCVQRLCHLLQAASPPPPPPPSPIVNIISRFICRWCKHLGASCITLPPSAHQASASHFSGGDDNADDIPHNWHVQLLHATSGQLQHTPLFTDASPSHRVSRRRSFYYNRRAPPALHQHTHHSPVAGGGCAAVEQVCCCCSGACRCVC
jgi:hypothetical protein